MVTPRAQYGLICLILAIVSQGHSWHCTRRWGCLSNGEEQRVSFYIYNLWTSFFEFALLHSTSNCAKSQTFQFLILLILDKGIKGYKVSCESGSAMPCKFWHIESLFLLLLTFNQYFLFLWYSRSIQMLYRKISSLLFQILAAANIPWLVARLFHLCFHCPIAFSLHCFKFPSASLYTYTFTGFTAQLDNSIIQDP